jgi:hypothetical protein
MFAEMTDPVTAVPATTLESSTNALVNSFKEAFDQVIAWAPQVVAVIVLLVVGYIASRLVARVVTLLAEKVGFQTAADRSGLSESMQHMGIRRNVPAILGTITFWLLM